MDNPIFDGECHALSDKYGYIANKFNGTSESLQENIEELIEMYADYLYSNDKEKVIEYLTTIFRSQIIRGYTPDDYQIVVRPPWVVGALAQYGTVCLKFERSEKDDLSGCNAESRKGCCCR